MRQVTVRPWILGLGLALAALGLHGQTAPTTRAIPLDIPADWEPVLCKGRLFLFSTEGRNQLLSPGDDAPQCDPVHFTPPSSPSARSPAPWSWTPKGTSGSSARASPRRSTRASRAPWTCGPRARAPGDPFQGPPRAPGRAARAAFPSRPRGATPSRMAAAGSGARKQAARVSRPEPSSGLGRHAAGAPGPAPLAEDILVSGSLRRHPLGAVRAGREAPARLPRRRGADLCPPLSPATWSSPPPRPHGQRRALKDGQLAWQFRASGRPGFGPFPVAAGLLVAEAGGRRLVILLPQTGKVRLDLGSPLGQPCSTPRRL